MDSVDFAVIVEDTKKVVLAAISRHLYPRFADNIDDVAQETYIRAYKQLVKGKFRNEAALSTWLYTIARNESLRMNQKLQREEKKLQNKKQQLTEDTESNWWEMDYEKDLLQVLIQGLPQKFRDVLVLVSMGMSIQEISDQLQISQGTVKSRTHRGKEMVRDLYQKNLQRQILQNEGLEHVTG